MFNFFIISLIGYTRFIYFFLSQFNVTEVEITKPTKLTALKEIIYTMAKLPTLLQNSKCDDVLMELIIIKLISLNVFTEP